MVGGHADRLRIYLGYELRIYGYANLRKSLDAKYEIMIREVTKTIGREMRTITKCENCKILALEEEGIVNAYKIQK